MESPINDKESLFLIVVTRVVTSELMTRIFSVMSRDVTLADVSRDSSCNVESRDTAEVTRLVASVVVRITASSLENLQSSPHSPDSLVPVSVVVTRVVTRIFSVVSRDITLADVVSRDSAPGPVSAFSPGISPFRDRISSISSL